MFLASFLCASLFFLSCAQETTTPDDYIDGQEDGQELRYQEYIKKRGEAIQKILRPFKTPCNVPECRFPSCEEYGPPPFCPRNVTICRSGCACIKYCKDKNENTFCYQTKFCRTPRRFSPDDDFFATSPAKLID